MAEKDTGPATVANSGNKPRKPGELTYGKVDPAGLAEAEAAKAAAKAEAEAKAKAAG